MKTPFRCPCCETKGLADLAQTAPGTNLLVVCPGCAAYCMRYSDEWGTLDSEDIQILCEHHPVTLAMLEDQRIKLAEAWGNGTVKPPTIFAEVMVEMVRTRGLDSILWKGEKTQ